MELRGLIKNIIAKRLFGTGPTDDWSYVDQFTGPAKDIRLLGLYQGVAYRCINTIAEAMGDKYEPFIYTLDSKGVKQTVPTHPLLQLLHNPNPDLSFYQLIEGSASFIEQFGEFFWYMVPGKVTGYDLNGPKEIILLRPDKVGMVLDKNTGEVIGYKYNTGAAGGTVPFGADEIIHQMTFNPKNPYRGYATTEAAIDYIQTEEEVSRFTRNYFRNNASLSGVLNVSGKVPRDNWNKFVRQWRERYAGTDNAGKVALVRDSQTTFTPTSSNISDMQLDQLKQTTIDQILMMYRIPKGLFGMESDQGLGRASVETLEYIFTKWTLDNKMGRFDDTLQRCLARYWQKDNVTMTVDHKNIVPADKTFELQVYNQGVDRWLTRKEIRDKDPDLQNNDIEGADQLFVLNTQLPIDDAMSSEQAASKPAIIPPNNGASSGGDDTPGDDDDDSDDGDGADGKSMPKRKDDVIRLVKPKSKKKALSKADKEAFRVKLMKSANSFVPQYKDAFNGVLDKQMQSVKDNMKHVGAKNFKGIADNSFNMGQSNSDMQNDLQPILNDLMTATGQIALEFSGNNGNYTFSKSVANAVQASTKKMAANFNQETLDALNSTISDGVAAGEGADAISNRIESVYDDAKGYRADRIARTESINASNSATLDAYQQNPAVTAMEWSADSDPCPYCEALDGTQVGLDDSFVAQGDSVDVGEGDDASSYQADYGDVDTPPLHPNCECTIVPVTIGGDGSDDGGDEDGDDDSDGDD